MDIGGKEIGRGGCFVVAEISANHEQVFQKAIALIQAAKSIGADAVKVQAYIPHSLTINCDKDCFRIKKGPWKGQTLYELYQKTYMPFAWLPKLKEYADGQGITFFSTVYHPDEIDVLEKINVPAYKIASFELVDIPLLKEVGRTKKPVILSTGMATMAEVREAVDAIGHRDIVLLKCTSAYPAKLEEMHLQTITLLRKAFKLPVGLSNHNLDMVTPVAAVALGAVVIEQHLRLLGTDGPDKEFSLPPMEFMNMITNIRAVEKTLSKTKHKEDKTFRRSLFAVKDIREGENFTSENARSIRPSDGLPPKYLPDILGKRATQNIERGTPLQEHLIGG